MNEPLIAALSVEIVPCFTGCPRANADLRLAGPPKRARRRSLIPSVDPDRVMSARAAEPIARAAHIGVGTCIDQDLFDAGSHEHA